MNTINGSLRTVIPSGIEILKDNQVIKFCQSLALMASFLLCDMAWSAKQYTTLSEPVSNAPDVTAFFSFYCPPCYLFSEQYNVVAGINRLRPADAPVTRYHISSMGKFGRELSDAWAVATVMGVADRVEKLMFIAVQQQKAIKSSEDIYTVFLEAGISREAYDAARQSMMVRAFIARQDAMADALMVRGTPSVYVRGRYLIDNSKIRAETPEAYVSEYSELVVELLKK
ncbi:DsbA family protein [Pantoea ananatis]|uniref:DsbA family protein n=1 Tax=Pantoea ananas TaxID=553 RepID=UPI0024AD7D30|nr:DsbA family protein [Pantoea ananatis]MDI6539555.1 DsbA family protein [Pantoea ananatis]